MGSCHCESQVIDPLSLSISISLTAKIIAGDTQIFNL